MSFSDLAVTTALLAGILYMDTAHATYTPPAGQTVDPVIATWVSGLYSDHGRCCELSDAVLDVQLRSDADSPTGLDAEANGIWYPIDAGSMHIFQKTPTGDQDVTDNMLGQALLWVQKANDIDGTPVVVPRCLLLGALY